MISRRFAVVVAIAALASRPSAQTKPGAAPAPPDSGAEACDAQLTGGRPLESGMPRAWARALLRVKATPAQRQAWSSCLDTQAPGVRLYVVEETATTVQAEVSYHGAPGEAPRVRLDVEGGRIDNTYKTKFIRVKNGEGVMLAITRETPQSHVDIVAGAANGRWDEAVSPAPGVDVKTVRPPAEHFLGGGQRVTVSNGDKFAKLATDGDTKTTWNSGGLAPQWIEIAFTPAKTITQVQLIIEQRPRGITKHTVRGYRADGTEVLLGFFWSVTDAGSELSARIAPAVGRGITRVRVDSDAGASWVAFREVRLFGY